VKQLKELIDKYTLSVITVFWAMAFFVASFIVPPTGIIEPSVLTAIGEIFAFVAAVTGIKEWGTNYRSRYRNYGETKDKEGEDDRGSSSTD